MFAILGMVWDNRVREWGVLVMESTTSFRVVATIRHNRVGRSTGLGAAVVEMAYDAERRELLAVGSLHDGACSAGVMRLALGGLLDALP